MSDLLKKLVSSNIEIPLLFYLEEKLVLKHHLQLQLKASACSELSQKRTVSFGVLFKKLSLCCFNCLWETHTQFCFLSVFCSPDHRNSHLFSGHTRSPNNKCKRSCFFLSFLLTFFQITFHLYLFLFSFFPILLFSKHWHYIFTFLFSILPFFFL